MQDGRCFEVLASCGRSGKDKDARTNDGPNPQRGQRPRPQSFFEPMFGTFRIGDQLVDGFAGKQLVVGQWSAPSCFGCVVPELTPAPTSSLTLCRTARQLLHFALFRTTRVITGLERLFSGALFAGGAFCFLAVFFA